MKEFANHSEPLPQTPFATATQLCHYIQHMRGVDQSVYSGELLLDTAEGAYVGFQTLQTHRPSAETLPLETTCTIALPTMQGALTVSGDWMHSEMAIDTVRYQPLDGTSTVQDAILVLASLMGTPTDARKLYELPYISMELASHRMDISRFNATVANKNGSRAGWDISMVSDNQTGEPIQVRAKRQLHSWSQLQWHQDGTVRASSETGTSPRPDTMLKHLWSEAAACIEAQTPEGRPLYPMEALQRLCEHNLEAVLVRAGERPL